MRLTVLGCWAPYPRTKGACSGYLLQDGGASFLLDVGHGVFSRLTEFINFRDLQGVIITHFHPDHYTDVYCVRHAVEGALRDGSMKRKVQLIIPSEPNHIYRELYGYTGAFDVIPIESLPEEVVPPGVKVRVFDRRAVRFYFLPVKHAVPSYAVGVEGSGYLVYSGDTAYVAELERFIEKADIFLCEASGMDSDAEYLREIHLTASQVGKMARKAKVKELIITHFWPEYDTKKLRREAERGYEGRVEAAVEGDTYFVY